MPTATLTSKGQITIPLSLRVALGLHAGAKLDFVPSEDGFKVVPLRHASSTLKGRFAGRVAGPVSLAAMDEAIASEAATQQLVGLKSVRVGLADLLISGIAKNQGCSCTVSFDKDAVRSAGMTLLT